MSATELELTPRSIRFPASRRSVDAPAENAAFPLTVLFGALRRRWGMFLAIGAISLGIGALSAMQFARSSAEVKATLIYRGLPGLNQQSAYEPLPSGTCMELMTSLSMLDKLQEAQGWRMPHALMASLVQAKVDRNSSLMTVTLRWNDLEDGIAALNALADIFIDEIAQQRSATLRDYIQHFEVAHLQARTEVDEAREQYRAAQREVRRIEDENASHNEQYKSLLASAANTELAIDERRVQQVGIEQQSAAIRQNIQDLSRKQSEAVQAAVRQATHQIKAIVDRRQAAVIPATPMAGQLAGLSIDLEEAARAAAVSADVNQWRQRATTLLAERGRHLMQGERDEIDALVAAVHQNVESTTNACRSQIAELNGELQQRQWRLIPIKNQIAMLETRLAEYRKQADEMAETIASADSTPTEATLVRLEQAQDRQKSIGSQLTALQELERCRTREWSISTPASAQTAVVSSNRLKLFAMGATLCGLALCTPVLLAEWNQLRVEPPVKLAQSLALPVLGQGLTNRIRAGAPREPLSDWMHNEPHLETLRMLALRIQQSAPDGGSMIMFSSIDEAGSATELTAATAECLAQRMERVLVIDATAPNHSSQRLTQLLAPSEASEKVHRFNGDFWVNGDENLPGLAELFHGECDCCDDLIRTSSIAGVDVVTSGIRNFPREAMASKKLTDFLDACRLKYGHILVNGPAVAQKADSQMLAARADGIVLTASKQIARDNRARSALVELIELGAPLIGIVT
jgi:Mrp family chromosome partitioning ATPase